LSAMRSLGKRISPVQLRVRAPVSSGRAQAPQSSQRSDEFHKLVVSGAAPETATILRQGFGWRAILASMQQPADFFCKEIMPGQHPPSLRAMAGQAGWRLHSLWALRQQLA
jgi:hypothetical protein